MPTVVQHATADRGPQNFYLQNAASTTNDGFWMPLDGIRPFTVTVSTSTAGPTLTVQLLVSDTPLKPLDADNNWPRLGSDINTVLSDGAPVFDSSWKWIKARVTALSAGTVTVAVWVG